MRVSEITEFLEHAYGVLNDTYFEGSLPPVVITVNTPATTVPVGRANGAVKPLK